MKYSKHLKIAGALQIVQTSMGLLFGIMYVILYVLNIQEGSQRFELQMALLLAFLLLIGIGPLWFGISLVMQKPWTTRVWGFVCCAPSLFSFPMLIGAYTLWVMIMVRQANAKAPEQVASPTP